MIAYNDVLDELQDYILDENNIQKIVVTPQMQDLANKYEWNKELAIRLLNKKVHS